MYYDEILELTYEQIANLSDFSVTLKNLQSSIVKSEIENIQSSIEQEEKLLNRIKNCEEKRAASVKSALNHYELDTENVEAMDRIADILKEIDPETFNEFNQARTLLLEKVKEVLLLNTQNEMIINNSRAFIRDLIKNILGSRKENFFDRKV